MHRIIIQAIKPRLPG